MIRHLISLFIIVIISFLTSCLFDVRPDEFLLSTLYTVSGIMFSIGLGLIASFNLSSVKNRNYLKKIRLEIQNVRNSFIILFGLSTICLVINQYLPKQDFVISIGKNAIHYSPSIMIGLVMIYSILFFIVNFLEVQKLNNDIIDQVLEEEQ